MNSLLRLPTVQSVTGLSRSTIYAFISQGKFPKPVPIGTRSVGWVSSEVDNWVKSRISERLEA